MRSLGISHPVVNAPGVASTSLFQMPIMEELQLLATRRDLSFLDDVVPVAAFNIFDDDVSPERGFLFHKRIVPGTLA